MPLPGSTTHLDASFHCTRSTVDIALALETVPRQFTRILTTRGIQHDLRSHSGPVLKINHTSRTKLAAIPSGFRKGTLASGRTLTPPTALARRRRRGGGRRSGKGTGHLASHVVGQGTMTIDFFVGTIAQCVLGWTGAGNHSITITRGQRSLQTKPGIFIESGRFLGQGRIAIRGHLGHGTRHLVTQRCGTRSAVIPIGWNDR